MNPVRTFDQITQEILNKNDFETITVGILIADGNQASARDYIINYMDMFDRKSGKFIDFFVPGYCENIFGNDVNIERRCIILMLMVNGVVIAIYRYFTSEGIKQHIILINFYLTTLLLKWKKGWGLNIHIIQCLFLLK